MLIFFNFSVWAQLRLLQETQKGPRPDLGCSSQGTCNMHLSPSCNSKKTEQDGIQRIWITSLFYWWNWGPDRLGDFPKLQPCKSPTPWWQESRGHKLLCPKHMIHPLGMHSWIAMDIVSNISISTVKTKISETPFLRQFFYYSPLVLLFILSHFSVLANNGTKEHMNTNKIYQSHN